MKSFLLNVLRLSNLRIRLERRLLYSVVTPTGVDTNKEEQMDKWIAVAAAIPASGVFAWIVVRFVVWRKKFLASLWQQAEDSA
jgi:hypothetical protein